MRLDEEADIEGVVCSLRQIKIKKKEKETEKEKRERRREKIAFHSSLLVCGPCCCVFLRTRKRRGFE